MSVTGAYERLLRGAYVPVKSKLQHPPPGHTRAFDAFSYPGGRECDEISLPGVGHLITTFALIPRGLINHGGDCDDKL